MKYANSVKLSAFSHQDENKASVLESFLSFFPFSIEDNGVYLKKTRALGFNERKIEILEITLAKSGMISQFLRNLLDNLDENQKKGIMAQIESRLGKNLDFFMRMLSYQAQRSCFSQEKGCCFEFSKIFIF